MTRRFSDSTNSYYEYDTDGGNSEYYSDIEEDASNEETRIVVKVDNIPMEMEDRAILELIGSGLSLEFQRKCPLSKVNVESGTRSIEVIVPDQETLREVIHRGNQVKIDQKYLQVYDNIRVQGEGIRNFAFVFGFNNRNEEMIRKHFSQYGDILSIFQKDESSIRIQFYSKKQLERALKNTKCQYERNTIYISRNHFPSLLILDIPPSITKDKIIQVLIPHVHPILVTNVENQSCRIFFEKSQDFEKATRCLLTTKVDGCTLKFSLHGRTFERRKNNDTQIQKKMQEAGIPSKITQRIVSNLSQYQIDFLNREEKVLEKLISQYKNPSSKKNFICFIIFIVIVIIFLVYFVL